MSIIKLEFEVNKRVRLCIRELILAKIGFGAAKKVSNLRSKLNICLVLKKIFRLLENRENERRLGLEPYFF